MADKSYTRKPSKPIRIGQRFGRLVVCECRGPSGKNMMFQCVCDCGASSITTASNLRSGHTTSCGCYKRVAPFKHGLSHKAEYGIWHTMHSRCSDPSNSHYRSYGGRGITVCNRWNDVTVFLEDVGPRPSPNHSLDRINNDGNYEPGNVKWSTRIEQQNNMRNTIRITFRGKSMTIREISQCTGIPTTVLRERIYRGWTEDRWDEPVHC